MRANLYDCGYTLYSVVWMDSYQTKHEATDYHITDEQPIITVKIFGWAEII